MCSSDLREVWRKSREERSSWSTPLVVESGGRTQAIVAAAGRTRSYDPATGELIWEAAGLTENVIPMPVTGHGLVYVMSGFRGFSIQAIRLDAKGDVTDSPAIAWNVRRSAPYVPSPVLSGDRLYMIKSNDAFLSCLNALTGEVIYQDQRLDGLRGLRKLAESKAIRGMWISFHPQMVGSDSPEIVADLEALVRALEFSVVSTTHEFPWAAVASVVLPMAAWAEETGTYTNYAGRVQITHRAVAPVGEAQPLHTMMSTLQIGRAHV